MPAEALAQSSTDIYRRQARRIRCVHADSVVNRQRALHVLAVSATPAPTEASPTPSASKSFADDIAAALEGNILRHSQRVRLLKQAGRYGIDRFEANLLIAAVQHRARSTPVDAIKVLRGRAFPTHALALILIIQSLIATGILLILRA
ncbi:MAG TPA: hypothetical protein VIL86_04275 [Tepidisphaeraceae bacterium]|jgi:hypothetical protein